jgi:Phage integrase, N-terminal SAM-like domain
MRNLIRINPKRREEMCNSQRRRDETRPAVHFAEYMTHWFARKKTTWKASTVRATESILRAHLVPYFGNQDLSTITSLNIHGLMSKMLAAGLSKKTVNNVLGILKTALRDAVEFQYLTQNNADHVRALKVLHPPFRFWTEEQSKVFFASAENHEPEWRTFFRVALTTGLRFGESGAQCRHRAADGGENTRSPAASEIESSAACEAVVEIPTADVAHFRALFAAAQTCTDAIAHVDNQLFNIIDDWSTVFPRTLLKRDESAVWRALRHSDAARVHDELLQCAVLAHVAWRLTPNDPSLAEAARAARSCVESVRALLGLDEVAPPFFIVKPLPGVMKALALLDSTFGQLKELRQVSGIGGFYELFPEQHELQVQGSEK